LPEFKLPMVPRRRSTLAASNPLGDTAMRWHPNQLFSQPSPSVVRALVVLSTAACLYLHSHIAITHTPLLFIPYEPHSK